MGWIIYSGTLGSFIELDTYSYMAAIPGIELIKNKNIPLVFCSNQTKAEFENLRSEIGNNHPFIVENGSAIYIPKEYFEFEIDFDDQTDDYYIIKFGTPHETLIQTLNEIRLLGIEISCFYEMDLVQISKLTGLSIKQAELAKNRQYSTAFIVDKKFEKTILNTIKDKNLQIYKENDIYYLTQESDTSKAIEILNTLFKKYLGIDTLSIGIGSQNIDLKMLDFVDMPYLVQNKDQTYASKKYNKINAIGPVGWNKIVTEIILKDK